MVTATQTLVLVDRAASDADPRPRASRSEHSRARDLLE